MHDRRWLRPFALMHTVVEGETCAVDSLNRAAEKLKPADAWMSMELRSEKAYTAFQPFTVALCQGLDAFRFSMVRVQAL